MLVDVKMLRAIDPITSFMSCGVRSVRFKTGVYISNHWNFEFEFRGSQTADDYKPIGDFSAYGVCDSPDQLLESLPEEVTSGPDPFVISVVRIARSEQPPLDGWRWHKWGPYIGKKEPRAEYLYDERDIDEVWTYHVYRVEPQHVAQVAS